MREGFYYLRVEKKWLFLVLADSSLGIIGLFASPANQQIKYKYHKLERFFSEVCLLEQTYIKDSDRTVKEVLDSVIAKLGENITIRRYARFQLGEGLPQRSSST